MEVAGSLDEEGFWWRPAGQHCPPGNLASGHTAGSIGHLPFPTPTSGVALYCLAAQCSLGPCEITLRMERRCSPCFCPPLRRSAHLFRVLLLERLQLPLTLTEGVCEGCQAPLDTYGRHRAGCSRSGRLKKRAIPTERALARVCREEGATVMSNVLLRDMNVDVPASGGRRIEVLAQDLPCFTGTHLAMDITLRSPLTSPGEAHPNAADTDGAVLLQARRDKERTYPELTAGRCKLVVLGIETGGRWAEEGVQLLRQLSVAKAREVPAYMARCVSLAWERRWTRLLSTVCATSFAASLVEPVTQCDTVCCTGGATLFLADLLGQDPR